MNTYIKEKWAENEINALPDGEHNYFERKGAGLLSNNDFFMDLAKALSAFANSGGGHIIIGQEDNCSITGVNRVYSGKKGKSTQSMREWLEDIIPNLLSYPLRDFRVHEVEISSLPDDKVVIVIDIGDSKLAPHQTNVKSQLKAYYQRFGSNSVPAEHHNISLLFGRSRFPSKEVAKSWLYIVVNPLINYLTTESENLKQRKRLWEREHKSLSYTALKPINFLFTNGSTFCDADILEQFLEFATGIEELLRNHDETIKVIDERFNALYDEIKKCPLIRDQFNSVTSDDALLEVAASDYDLKKCPSEQLFTKIFGLHEDKDHPFDFVITLMINKIPRWDGNSKFDLFWQSKKEMFLSDLQYPPLSTLDHHIDESYETCYKINLKIIEKLNENRKQLSIEHGIPLKEISEHKDLGGVKSRL